MSTATEVRDPNEVRPPKGVKGMGEVLRVADIYGSRDIVAVCDRARINAASRSNSGDGVWLTVQARGLTVSILAGLGGENGWTYEHFQQFVRECQTGRFLSLAFGVRVENTKFSVANKFIGLLRCEFADLVPAEKTMATLYGARGVVLLADDVAPLKMRTLEADPGEPVPDHYMATCEGMGWTWQMAVDKKTLPPESMRELIASRKLCGCVAEGEATRGNHGPVLEAKRLLSIWPQE